MREDDRLEFKQITEDGALPASTAKELVSFVNSKGGVIMFGYADDGEIIGVADPDDAMTRITNMAKTQVSPDILPFIDLERKEIEGKSIIECRIAMGSEKPYYITKQGMNTNGIYVRKGSSCHNADNLEIRSMLFESASLHWENGTSFKQDLTFKNLEHLFRNKNLELYESKMKTLGLINNKGKYTNLALLLSEQCPYRILRKSYKDEKGTVLSSKGEYTGSILFQIESAMGYLHGINDNEYTIKGFYRFDRPDYPEEALREMIMNAVLHRDYSYSADTYINIYPDRITVVSCGNLVDPITMDSLYSGMSATRNPMLMNIFYRTDLVEGYGTGVQKMTNMAKENNSDGTFKEIDHIFSVTITNGNKARKRKEEAATRLTDDVVLHDGSSPQENVHQKELEDIYITVAVNGIVTRKEVEEILGIGTTKAFMLLKELVDDGKIHQEKKGRSSYYHL